MALEALAEAIEGVVIHPDETVLAGALGLRDRLDAKISTAVGELDAAELWDVDGSVSMAAWLRIHGGRTQREATRMSVTARKLRSLPGVSAAWASGALSGGHVDAIVAIVTNRTLELFAENEAKVLADIVGLGVEQAVAYLRDWQAHAEAWLDSLEDDEPEPPEPRRELFLSPMLDGKGRDIARFFLDHQQTKTGGPPQRHRHAAGPAERRARPHAGRRAAGSGHPAPPGLRRRHPPDRHRRQVLDPGLRAHHPHHPPGRLHLPGRAGLGLPVPRLRPPRRLVRRPPRPALGARRVDRPVEPHKSPMHPHAGEPGCLSSPSAISFTPMENVKNRRRGTSRVSSKHQVTIPTDALRAAGLEVGERLVAHADGPGRVVFEREVDLLAEFAGALTGVYERDELSGLRDEWD